MGVARCLALVRAVCWCACGCCRPLAVCRAPHTTQHALPALAPSATAGHAGQDDQGLPAEAQAQGRAQLLRGGAPARHAHV
jgi:hypothetical protein